MAREKLIDHVKSVSDFDYCIGVHMELDEQTKRDTALNKFSRSRHIHSHYALNKFI